MINIFAQTNLWEGIDVGRHLFLFSPMIALVVTMLAVVACPIVVGRSTRKIAGVVAVGLIVTFVLTLRVSSAVADGGVSGFQNKTAATQTRPATASQAVGAIQAERARFRGANCVTIIVDGGQVVTLDTASLVADSTIATTCVNSTARASASRAN